MRSTFRFDATLGFAESGLWFGQVVAAALLLFVVTLTDLSLVAWPASQTRVAAVVLLGSGLVGCATLRVLVSALLLTTRGVEPRGRTATGVRLAEALVACAATGLVGLVALDTAVRGDVERLAVEVGTSPFDTLVLVLAVLVVTHAAGSTLFATVSRTS
jgi:hypothetical protein